MRSSPPNLKVGLLRCNVGTRLAKLAAGEVDATLLALAGLKRLGLADLLAPIHDSSTAAAVGAERAIAHDEPDVHPPLAGKRGIVRPV
jgi:hydroxymethylbilane synthase